MKKFSWLEAHPVEAVIFLVSLGLLIFSVFALSPVYPAEEGNALVAALPTWASYLTGGYFILSSLPGLIAPFNSRIPNVWLEWGTFSMFLSYLFLAMLRVLLYGWFPLTWFSLLVVSLLAGVLRVYLSSHRE